MVEINPLIVSDAGDLKCLDAKMGFDSNALYRSPTFWRCGTRPKKTPRNCKPANTT